MPVTLKPSQVGQLQWFPVDLGNGDTIEIAMSLPTLEDQLQALDSSGGSGYQAYALASAIRDWRGVFDEQNLPVSYSWESLNLLCAAYPDACFGLLAIRRKLLQGLSEIERKNSPEPPAVGGEAISVTTTTSIETSCNTSISSAPSGSAARLESPAENS